MSNEQSLIKVLEELESTKRRLEILTDELKHFESITEIKVDDLIKTEKQLLNILESRNLELTAELINAADQVKSNFKKIENTSTTYYSAFGATLITASVGALLASVGEISIPTSILFTISAIGGIVVGIVNSGKSRVGRNLR